MITLIKITQKTQSKHLIAHATLGDAFTQRSAHVEDA